MKIYVIRHGETDANKNGVLQGSSNWPLNEDGVKLAKISGSNMKGIKFDACFSSPLDRALETARIVLKYSDNNIDIQKDERLKEFDMGIYEGKKVKKGELEVPLLKILAFKINPFLCGRFKEGETIKELCVRTQDFLNEIKDKKYNNVLISTHGCALRAMLNKLYPNKLNFWQGAVPYNCAVNIIEAYNGHLKLIEKDKLFYDLKYAVDRYKF